MSLLFQGKKKPRPLTWSGIWGVVSSCLTARVGFVYLLVNSTLGRGNIKNQEIIIQKIPDGLWVGIAKAMDWFWNKISTKEDS